MILHENETSSAVIILCNDVLKMLALTRAAVQSRQHSLCSETHIIVLRGTNSNTQRLTKIDQKSIKQKSRVIPVRLPVHLHIILLGMILSVLRVCGSFERLKDFQENVSFIL